MKKIMVYISRFFYVCLICTGLLSLLPSQPSAAAQTVRPIQVKFRLNNILYSFVGEKIAVHTYMFNKGAARKITITTVDWAPYTGEEICNQGWVQQLTIALLASQGYEITSTFLPWARTIARAEKGEADILYPEYYIEPGSPSDVNEGTKRLDHLALSRKFPGGPIVFMKRTGDVDRFKGSFLNLRNEKIGVVRGYQNTPEFDAFMDRGYFNISLAVDDLMNIQKLINNRIDLVIGDPAVISYGIMNSDLSDTEKTHILNGIQIVQPEIQYNYLYYAVSKKKPGWETTLKDLNAAMLVFEASGLMFDIISETNSLCGFNLKNILRPYKK